MSRTSSSTWLPLGSALAVDWKHLGRPASARGASAWVAALDGESVILRSWGEETTSFFDFVLLSDERVAGSIIVSCTRGEANRLRLKTDVELEGHVTYTDTSEFRENARTLMLAPFSRVFEAKRGGLSERDVPAISAQAAELFEIAPDSALQTACADWLLTIVGVCRDVVRRSEGADVPRVSDSKNGKAAASPAAQPRARTEHAVRPSPARETMDVQNTPRRASPAIGEVSRERSVPEAITPAPAPARERAERPERAERSAGAGKLTCTTNTGESFEITGDETFIGRSKQCGIVLKSQRVSRKHACVTREADGFYINDLGAANGIWAGSEKIDREKIKTGDEFIIGDVVLTFSFA